MVVLSITPHRGNNARSFPSTGFLGLTPVTLAGTIRTTVQEDKRMLEASSVVVRVRCYESTGQFSASAATPAINPSTNSTRCKQSDPTAAVDTLRDRQPISDVFSFSTGHALVNAQSDCRPLLASVASSSSSSSASTKSLDFNGIASASTSDYQTSATSSCTSDSEPIPRQTKAKVQDKGRVLYEQSVTVWTPNCRHSSKFAKGKAKETEPQYGNLGDFSAPWRLSIPIDAVRNGARSTMIFRTWRIWWAVEAIVFHKPAGVHGDRLFRSQQLTLLNYSPVDWQAIQKPKPVAWSVPSSAKQVPDYKVSMQPATNFIGAGDPVEFAYHVRRHTHHDSPRRLVIEFRRETSYLSPTTSSNGNLRRSSAPPAGRRGDHFRSCTGAQSSTSQPGSISGSSHHAHSIHSHSSAPAQAPDQDVLLATFDATLDFASKASCRGRISGHMPQTRSVYHYAVGESCRTPAGQARFYFVAKLLYRHEEQSMTSTARDIRFTTVSENERSRARAQLGRVLAIHEAEERIFGNNDPELVMSDDESILRHASRESEGNRVNSARRHSDHTDMVHPPRTPAHHNSCDVSATLSPILSVNSPTMSDASASTFRPRSVKRGRGSHRALRPKSSSGWSTASTQAEAAPSIEGNHYLADRGELQSLASVLLPKSSPIAQKSDEVANLVDALQGFALQSEQAVRPSPSHATLERRRPLAKGDLQAQRAAEAAAAGKQSRGDSWGAPVPGKHRIIEQQRDESPSARSESGRRKSSSTSGLSNFFRRSSKT